MDGGPDSMIRQVILADAGPMIALARVDRLELLRGLFGRIYLTRTVHEEILPASTCFPETAVLARTLSAGWIEVVEPVVDAYQPLNPGLDVGEASTIGLALSWRAGGRNAVLIMDDQAGRREARTQGLALMGTAALIGLAKQRGMIAAAGPVLDQLVKSGYFISASVVEAVLDRVGER